MDFLLLGFCVFGFVTGYIKGFVSTLFSLVGSFVVVIISWKLTPYCSLFIEKLIGNNIFSMIKNAFDNILQGSFSSIEDFSLAIGQTQFGGLISMILSKFLKNAQFEGELTAGQILAPTLSQIIINIITFILLFFVVYLGLNILKCILSKLTQKLKFGFGNKILGGLLGMTKAILLFVLIFAGISVFANFSQNSTLLNFVQSGQISTFLFQNIEKIIINLFY